MTTGRAPQFLPHQRPTPGFLVIGHRGAAARAPENTGASLRAGIAAGAGAVEIDVQVTLDGRLAVIHDTTLDRTTSGRGPLRRKSWPELSALDAGAWFAPRFAGERLLDLDAALALLRGRVPVIVEIKARASRLASRIPAADRQAVGAVIEALERTGGLREATVSSSCWAVLEAARETEPRLDLALTVGWSELRSPLAWASRLRASALHPNRRLCSPAWVARAKEAGLLVFPYTVNRAAEFEPLIAAGVSGVFTDDPAAVLRMLGRRTEEPAVAGDIVLGIDQGSGGTRAVLLAGGQVIASRETRVASRRGRDGGIVQDAGAVAGSVVRSAAPLLDAAPRRVARAGLAAQRGSIVVWRVADSRPVTPVLSWRTGATPPPSNLSGAEDEIVRTTGLTARYPYGAMRLAALAGRDPAIARGLADGRLRAGPIGAFLAARLGRGRAETVDPSLAQRMLLLDAHTLRWSARLADRIGVPLAALPGLAPSSAPRGPLRLDGHRVSLAALAGDVGAAVRGLAPAPGEGILVLGTGGFVVVPARGEDDAIAGLLLSLLWEGPDGPHWGIEGTVHGLAANLAEAAGRTGLSATSPELIAAVGATVRRFPEVNPAIDGTGTPDWDPAPRFAVERGRFGAEAICRGTVEGLAAKFERIADLLRSGGQLPARFRATGGMAFAPHLVAAIGRRMRVEIEVDPRAHLTAIGAALLAGDAP